MQKQRICPLVANVQCHHYLQFQRKWTGNRQWQYDILNAMVAVLKMNARMDFEELPTAGLQITPFNKG